MRVVTRGDLDGLVGAVIVAAHQPVSSVELIHPQDITAGVAAIRSGDTLIGVPHDPRCGLWFDHHAHTATYREAPRGAPGAYGPSPSAARLVFRHFGGARVMPQLETLVAGADRIGSGQLTAADVTDPKGVIQLGLTLDSRTGIGGFRAYFVALFELLRRSVAVDDVLRHPTVAMRCRQMRDAEPAFCAALEEHSVQHGPVVVTDFRSLARIPVGNRYLVYTLFPSARMSLRLHRGPAGRFTVVALGHSIVNRGCRTDLGAIAARHGGGGHRHLASFPVRGDDPVDVLVTDLIAELRQGG